MTLHQHSFDHVHDQQFDHPSVIESDNRHSHLAEAHLSIDSSHADQHDSVSLEIDLSQKVLLKNISSEHLTIALFFIVLVLLQPVFYRFSYNHLRNFSISVNWRNYFSPPLRAPPL